MDRPERNALINPALNVGSTTIMGLTGGDQ